MTNTYELLGIGNALLDFQVEVPNEFLEKNALKKGSMQLVDAETQHRLIEKIKTEFKNHAIRQTSGGCAANTLAGFANLGGKAYFIGKVATDPYGDIYRKDLNAARVLADLHPGNTDHTGTCLALITPDAERTMLTHLGIATHLSAQDIDPEKVAASKTVYIEGYLWDPPSGRAASQELIKVAKQKSKKIAFTYSDSFCVERHFEDFITLGKTIVDVLFCNEAEALAATKTSKVSEAFRIMKEWAPIVCITTGPRGALLNNRQSGETAEIPTWDVKLVDKLGAGDLFAAGFLYGFTQGKNLAESGYLGCYSATKVIQQVSARLNEDLSKQVDIALKGPRGKAA